MKKLIFCLLVALVFFTSYKNPKQIEISNGKDGGTTYTIYNNVNGLVDFMYGVCGPIAAGQIFPSKSIDVFVKAGQSQLMNFRGPFGAPYCHCSARTLVGSKDKKTESITLVYKDFCDQ